VLVDQVFDLEQWFPAFFGVLSLVMLAGMLVNGRLVRRVGLDRMLTIIFGASTVTVVVLLAVSLAWSGRPPFALFVVVLGSVLFTQQMLIPNLNAAAMRPLAAVAGTAAAILGMVPGAVGSMIGGFIDSRFDGTVTPLAIGFVVCNLIALVAWRQAVVAVRRA
jgi:DHA1 family bicyclomycin/chloramphenicol resistance-like MFS transporter